VVLPTRVCEVRLCSKTESSEGTNVESAKKAMQVTTTDATDTAAASGVRRRLTPDERREIARLYAEADASTADIPAKFGTTPAPLARVRAGEGTPGCRGGGGQAAPRAAPPSSAQGPAEAAPRAAAATVARRRRTVARAESVSASSDAATQFRIEFRGERVFNAA